MHKTLPSAFVGTGLEMQLRERDVDTVTVVGYMTQHCVDSTARQAMHAGFAVEVLSDATGTMGYSNAAGAVDAEPLHTAQLVALQGGIAAVGTVDDWERVLRDGTRLVTENPVSSSHAFRSARITS